MMRNQKQSRNFFIPAFFTLLLHFFLHCQCAPSFSELLLFPDSDENEYSKITFPDSEETFTNVLSFGECEKYCVPLDFCSSLFALLQQPTLSNLQALRNTSCGFDDDRTPMHWCEDAICLDRKAQHQSLNDLAFLSGENSTQRPAIEPLQVDAFTTLNEEGCGTALFIDRIHGGENASRGEYPWLVALIGKADAADESEPEVFCAGSLISEEWILTAAHCVLTESQKPRNISYVRIGAFRLEDPDEEGAVNAKVLESIPHPQYQEVPDIINDIALVKLAEKVQLNSYINTICLPPNEFIVQSSMPMSIAGWGSVETRSNSNVLQKADVHATPSKECFRMYEKYKTTIVPSQQICAQGRATDSCKGDSGGPLMSTINGSTVAVGVISFGTTICDGRLPGVYTKVGSYMNWIQDTISKNKNVNVSTTRQSTLSLNKYTDWMT